MGKAEAPPRPPERRMQVCTCSGEDVGDPGGNRGWGYRDLLAKPIPRLSDSPGTERETETEKVLANFLSFIREPGPAGGPPSETPRAGERRTRRRKRGWEPPKGPAAQLTRKALPRRKAVKRKQDPSEGAGFRGQRQRRREGGGGKVQSRARRPPPLGTPRPPPPAD